MRLEDLENILAILLVRFVAGRAQRRTRCLGDIFQVFGGFQAEVDEVLVDDAADTVKSPVDSPGAIKPARFQDCADQGFVDHRRWAAPLGDKDVGF